MKSDIPKIEIKKASSIAESLGWELMDFTENSAKFQLISKKLDIYRRVILLEHELLEIKGIEYHRLFIKDGVEVFVKVK